MPSPRYDAVADADMPLRRRYAAYFDAATLICGRRFRRCLYAMAFAVFIFFDAFALRFSAFRSLYYAA